MNGDYSEEEPRKNEHEGEGNRESENDDNTTHEPLLSLEDWIKKLCASRSTGKSHWSSTFSFLR